MWHMGEGSRAAAAESVLAPRSRIVSLDRDRVVDEHVCSARAAQMHVGGARARCVRSIYAYVC